MGERLKIGFNLPAFLFGPFYYFMKGMWKKGGIILTGILFLDTGLMAIELLGNVIVPSMLYWVPGYALCASLANYDFFRCVVHQEYMWNPLRAFEHPALISVLVTFSMLMYGTFVWLLVNAIENNLVG